jgi:hypothetical protein
MTIRALRAGFSHVRCCFSSQSKSLSAVFRLLSDEERSLLDQQRALTARAKVLSQKVSSFKASPCHFLDQTAFSKSYIARVQHEDEGFLTH